MPVVVGAAQVVNRPGDGFTEQSATALMREACRRALDETGAAERLGASVGEVLVPRGTWPESDPGRAIADAVGAVDARSIRAELGVAQHALISRAATGVQSGRIRVALVAGGENRWSEVAAAKRGATSPAPPEVAASAEPDEVLAPAAWPIAQVEIDRNLTTAAHQYAILESAYRHHLGISVEQRQEQLGALWARMADVATRSEAAWKRTGMTAQEIVQPSASNRLIAAPYSKHLVTQWNVDQAAALVLTSVGVARELGVPEERWVFPLVVAISDDVAPVSERAELHRWPGAAIAAQAAFRSAGVGPDDLSAVDLYSCFPIAVEVQAREMGLGLDRPLTITGGMTFSGGPFNNYSLQGAAAMVELLRRSGPGDVGLTTAVSGFLTKAAVTLWSRAPRGRFEGLDVSAAAAAATERRRVDADLTGAATIVGATVIPSSDSELEVIAVVESSELVRTVASSDDQELAHRALVEDPVGWPVQVDAPGRFRFGTG
jgi:acetyl-CoA C-acetyltransferase